MVQWGGGTTFLQLLTLHENESERADYAAVQAECGNLSGNELTRNSSGNTRSQLSQLAESLWTDPSLKSEIDVCELISTKKKKKKKKKKAQAWNELSNILPPPLHHHENEYTFTASPPQWGAADADI